MAATPAATRIRVQREEDELEKGCGSLVYSVGIGSKEVTVDAGTGAVLHIESDGPEEQVRRTSPC